MSILDLGNSFIGYLLIGLLGLCVGSFLNVVIYRLPRMMEQGWRRECTMLLHPETAEALNQSQQLTLSKPASRCSNCGHQIRWYENIPVLSWIGLRGRCAQCRTPIGLRYPFVEVMAGLASLAIFWKFGTNPYYLIAALGFTWVLIALIGIDFDHQLLPDRLTIPLAMAGLAVSALGGPIDPVSAIWGLLAGFLSLWLVYIIFKIVTGKEGMGYGDFKLLAALGAWLGVSQLPIVILLSSVVGTVVGLLLMMREGRSQHFAFGPYLAIAGWLALLFGQDIISWYNTGFLHG